MRCSALDSQSSGTGRAIVLAIGVGRGLKTVAPEKSSDVEAKPRISWGLPRKKSAGTVCGLTNTNQTGRYEIAIE